MSPSSGSSSSTREAFRDLPASAARRCCCLRRAQPAASAELSTTTVDKRGAAAASGYASGRSALRLDVRRAPPPLLPTCPLRHPAAADDHTSVLSQALRTPRAGQLPLIINWISLWPLQVTLSVQRRRPPSLTSAFSLHEHDPHTSSRGVRSNS